MHNDIHGAESVVDGFFDHGFFQRLSVIDAHKKDVIIDRRAPVTIQGVPAWFMNMIPLKTHISTAEALLYRSGHSQKEMIILEASNAYAYEQLWLAMKTWVELSALIFFLGGLVVIGLLRWQLAPLKAIEAQALAISQRDFSINSTIPRTRELKRVVLAMNGMSEKLEHFVNELTGKAEQLILKMRLDNLTGLTNRHSFMDHLRASLRNEYGVLAIIHVHNLHAINDTYGYPTGNEVLRSIARILCKEKERHTEAFIGRISGTDFAIALPTLNIESFHHVFENLDPTLKTVSVSEDMGGVELIVGAASYQKEQSVSEVLARADQALAIAVHQEKSSVCIDDDFPVSWSTPDWRRLVDEGITHDQINLASQSLLDRHGDILYHNLLAMPQILQGKNIKTGFFVAMTELLGRGEDLDRLMTEKIFRHAMSHSDSGPWGLKLLGSSWYNERFQKWFQELLEQHPDISDKLFVICTEFSLIRDIAASKRHIVAIHASGGKMVMDHFGGGVSSFANLRQLNPDYIKLDGSHIPAIVYNDDHKKFLKVACDIAHALDIGVIVEHVENDKIKSVLDNFDIDVFQGYGISPVEILGN